MDLQLRGKRALVTGPTAGIGFATAAGVYGEGASVVAKDRTQQRAEEVVMKIRGTGGGSRPSGVCELFGSHDGRALGRDAKQNRHLPVSLLLARMVDPISSSNLVQSLVLGLGLDRARHFAMRSRFVSAPLFLLRLQNLPAVYCEYSVWTGTQPLLTNLCCRSVSWQSFAIACAASRRFWHRERTERIHIPITGWSIN
jgi:hypothetical protein